MSAVTVRNLPEATHRAPLFITSINLAELLAGVETMPQGERRDALAPALLGLRPMAIPWAAP